MHQCARGASGPQEVRNQIQHLRMQDRGRLEVFAGSRRASEDENAGADNGANAESRQRPRPERFLQAVAGFVGLGDELVDRLTG